MTLTVNSSNSSLPSPDCLAFRTTILILASYSITSLLLLVPLSAIIFYLGCQRRRPALGASAAKAATSHSDAVTYHFLSMQLVEAFSCVLVCVGVKTRLLDLSTHALSVFLSAWCVKIVFHALTCVECYLAVVHPVSYLGLRSRRGVRTRNAGIACVWLLWLLWEIFLTMTNTVASIILYYCLSTAVITVVCFCCLSVLWALKRPGPREEVKREERERADQRKQRAFNTVAIVLAALWLCLTGLLLNDVPVGPLSQASRCAVLFSGFWFSVPSSLVLPALYLHRKGKLPGWKPPGRRVRSARFDA